MEDTLNLYFALSLIATANEPLQWTLVWRYIIHANVSSVLNTVYKGANNNMATMWIFCVAFLTDNSIQKQIRKECRWKLYVCRHGLHHFHLLWNLGVVRLFAEDLSARSVSYSPNINYGKDQFMQRRTYFMVLVNPIYLGLTWLKLILWTINKIYPYNGCVWGHAVA
jgi:hypothetical protein